MVQDVGELLIYKTHSAAQACHHSTELAIAQFGSGLEDRHKGILSTSKCPGSTMVPGPSSLPKIGSSAAGVKELLWLQLPLFVSPSVFVFCSVFLLNLKKIYVAVKAFTSTDPADKHHLNTSAPPDCPDCLPLRLQLTEHFRECKQIRVLIASCVRAACCAALCPVIWGWEGWVVEQGLQRRPVFHREPSSSRKKCHHQTRSTDFTH